MSTPFERAYHCIKHDVDLGNKNVLFMAIEDAQKLIDVAERSRLLANFIFKSIDVGPLTKGPSKEAHYWRELRASLQRLYDEAS